MSIAFLAYSVPRTLFWLMKSDLLWPSFIVPYCVSCKCLSLTRETWGRMPSLWFLHAHPSWRSLCESQGWLLILIRVHTSPLQRGLCWSTQWIHPVFIYYINLLICNTPSGILLIFVCLLFSSLARIQAPWEENPYQRCPHCRVRHTVAFNKYLLSE